MREHLQVGVHVAGVALVDQSVVVSYTLNLAFAVQHHEQVRVHVLGFYSDDLQVLLAVHHLGRLLHRLCMDLMGSDPAHLAPE